MNNALEYKTNNPNFNCVFVDDENGNYSIKKDVKNLMFEI